MSLEILGVPPGARRVMVPVLVDDDTRKALADRIGYQGELPWKDVRSMCSSFLQADLETVAAEYLEQQRENR